MTKNEVISHTLRRHAGDVLAREAALYGNDDEAMHRFRLACKRLRFAVERFEPQRLAGVAKTLSQITDELGSAHDCVLLAQYAKGECAEKTADRALRDRGEYIARARDLWAAVVPLIREHCT